MCLLKFVICLSFVLVISVSQVSGKNPYTKIGKIYYKDSGEVMFGVYKIG